MFQKLPPCFSCFKVVWQLLPVSPLSPPHLLFTPVCCMVMALLFPQWVKRLNAHSPDLRTHAWLRRCPLLLPHGSALGELSCLHPMRISWRKTSSRCHMLALCDTTSFIGHLPLCYSSVRSNQPIPHIGWETEKQHIFHLNLKAETKHNRINAENMCWICHRSSAWNFGRGLDFEKLSQRSVCIWGFWLSLQIYLSNPVCFRTEYW